MAPDMKVIASEEESVAGEKRVAYIVNKDRIDYMKYTVGFVLSTIDPESELLEIFFVGGNKLVVKGPDAERLRMELM